MSKSISTKAIDRFIKHFAGSEDVFLHGMCYWFAFILLHRFDRGEIIYDPIRGHFMWCDDEGDAYDVLGAHEMPETYYIFDDLVRQDPKLYLRLYDECINKIGASDV